jgi:hypothetical protein
VQNGVRRRQNEIDGVVVDLHGFHVGRRTRLDLRVGAAHALEREDDIIGDEVLSIVELDALAQVEAPLQRVNDLPAFCKAWNDLQLFVALRQPFHHVAHGAERERLVQRVGVKRVQVALEGVSERLGAGGGGCKADSKHACYGPRTKLHRNPPRKSLATDATALLLWPLTAALAGILAEERRLVQRYRWLFGVRRESPVD